MRKGKFIGIRRLLLFTACFSALFFMCGAKIKVSSTYPDASQRNARKEGSQTKETLLKEEEEREVQKAEENDIIEPSDDVEEEDWTYRKPMEQEDVSSDDYENIAQEQIAPVVLPEIIEDNGSSLFLVGDSRTVYGYMDTNDERANWLAACGSSYPYFMEHYVPILDHSNLRGAKIVILYGINDVSYYGKDAAAMNWLSFYQTKAQDWIAAGATVYVCSVPGFDYAGLDNGTVCTPADIARMNQAVAEYNALMESSLPSNIGYIRLHYSTPNPLRDGVHYSVAEDRVFYEGIIDYFEKR